MVVGLTVKNTFVCVSLEDADSAGLRRSSSCPSLGVANATPRADVNSKDAVSQLASPDSDVTLSRLGTWADVDSDFDEQETPSGFSSEGLSCLSFTGEAYGPGKVDETPPAAQESSIVQTTKSMRTPLSSKASAFSPKIAGFGISAPHVPFVPISPLNSKASALLQRSSQAVSMPVQATDSLDAPGIPSQALTSNPKATTAMLRNLPCGFTRSALLEMLDNEGFTGLYDFVYVPIDFNRGLCKGYCFVNLTAAEHLQHLVEVFDGYSQWSDCSSMKICQATLSHTQGLRANIERYRNSPVMGDAVPDVFKPALFAGKQEIAFPQPTKTLPRVSQKISLQSLIQ
jgi:hypothetical protein